MSADEASSARLPTIAIDEPTAAGSPNTRSVRVATAIGPSELPIMVIENAYSATAKPRPPCGVISGTTDSIVAPNSVLLMVPLFIYLLYVSARILRSAIERPMFQCVMLILLQTFLEPLLLLALFGPGEAAATATGAGG